MKLVKVWSFAACVLVFAAAVVTHAQSPQKKRAASLDAVTLEKAAAATGFEQAILREAARKIRQTKTPAAAVEVPVTVSTSSGPLGCQFWICVGSGPTRACRPVYCAE